MPLLFFARAAGDAINLYYIFLGSEPMSSVANTRTLNPLADHTVSARLAKKRTRHVRERLIEGLLFLCASVSVVVTVGIVLILLTESYQFF